jgi:hypothetical protein
MKRAIAAFIVLLALILAIPWMSHAGNGHHGHGRHGGTRVYVGGGYWFGPPPFWGPRYYYGGPVYYGGPAYYAPPVVVQPAPRYIERGREEAEYWYYCENPQGYYPYVRSCPAGWMRVVPETVPPDR